MTESQEPEAAKQRDRSPAFPYIGLDKALERTRVLFDKAKRFDVRVADIAIDWGLTPKSSATDRTVAALVAFGLAETAGAGDAKKIKISEAGWRILEDARPGVKEELLAKAAVKPKAIADYSERWRDGRPDDTHAISDLRFDGGFTEDGARIFLRVFDETVKFASRDGGRDRSDTPAVGSIDVPNSEGSQVATLPATRLGTIGASPTTRLGTIGTSAGEREWLRGSLARESTFRLLVTGIIGPKEVRNLIKMLEVQAAVLADEDSEHTEGMSS
ncbi:MAG: hypothetical protein IT557_04235 [Alphaproteobacteria bacterium]|nr:hypothetical protein [Alphaproteobacteria bacterium]